MEEIRGQNSDLDKLEAKAQAENTEKATLWVMKSEKWCDKQKLKVDFNCVTRVEVNGLLRNSVLKLNRKKANH